MAQEESTTYGCYKVAAKRLIGTGAAVFQYVALDEASVTNYDEETNALQTESTKAGLARGVADTIVTVTTTATDDTVQFTKQFQAGATATIYGFAVFNAATGGDMAMWCTFAEGIPLISGDYLTCTGKIQFKKGV
jgi:hypothetical protein